MFGKHMMYSSNLLYKGNFKKQLYKATSGSCACLQ